MSDEPWPDPSVPLVPPPSLLTCASCGETFAPGTPHNVYRCVHILRERLAHIEPLAAEREAQNAVLLSLAREHLRERLIDWCEEWTCASWTPEVEELLHREPNWGEEAPRQCHENVEELRQIGRTVGGWWFWSNEEGRPVFRETEADP